MSTPDQCPMPAEQDRKPRRQMIAAELMGSHTHEAADGVRVTISQRGQQYIARGRWAGRQFGKTLGADPMKATVELRRLLVDIESGAFVPPSESRNRLLPRKVIPRLTLRELCDAFLAEKRPLRGLGTSTTYLSRLRPILDFAERQENLRKWKLARDLDRHFVMGLREFLMQRTTTPNGRAGATLRKMSLRQVQNCLETLRMALAWGLKAEVRKLPPEFIQPVTPEIIGGKLPKDPLRLVLIPLEKRNELLLKMDRWQLQTLSALTILPLRFEDLARALISDVDFERRTLRLGSHLGGNDFSKGKVDVTMPLPDELVKLFQICAGNRKEGPLFLSRQAIDTPGRFRTSWESQEEQTRHFEERLQQTSHPIHSQQDRKALYCQVMQKEFGAVSSDRISRELKVLFHKTGLERVRPYDIRSAVTTEMSRSGMSHLEMTYLTEHTVKDIMNSYTTLDPVTAMQLYFTRIEELLLVLRQRMEDWQNEPRIVPP